MDWSIKKLEKLAYYGYLEFFDELDNTNIYLDESNAFNKHLKLAILNGCHINDLFCIEYYKRGFEVINNSMASILLSNNVMTPYYDFEEKLWHNFKFPSIETCYKIIENRDNWLPNNLIYNEVVLAQIAGVAIIRDNIKLFVNCRLRSCYDILYAVSRYLNRDNFIHKLDSIYETSKVIRSLDGRISLFKKDECNFRNMNLVDELNINILDGEEKTEFSCYFDKLNESYSNRFIPNYEYSNYENNLRVREYHEEEFTKYMMINNTDLAINLNIINNLTLSKIILIDPRKNIETFKKYKPFLIYTKKVFPEIEESILSKYISIQPLIMYNILYISIICKHGYIERFGIDAFEGIKPEINLYIIAKRVCAGEVTTKLIEMFNQYGKFYKIMDLENECYLDPPEEIYEIPDVSPINLLKGDELNPYA